MLTKLKRGWEIPESQATPEAIFEDRRRLVKTLAAGPVLLAGSAAGLGSASAVAALNDPSASLYPAARNLRYRLDRNLTPKKIATTYNNFYEFGSHKQISKAAQALRIRPWTVTIDGLVEKKVTVDVDTLVRKMNLEERVYRLRCVEAWSMAVPWTGFPMADLVKFARPLSGAKYVVMETQSRERPSTKLRHSAAGPVLLAGSAAGLGSASAVAALNDPSASLYPAARNLRYRLDRNLTPKKIATTYNNFYEFGSHKQISKAAQALRIRPWTVTIDGLVEKKVTVDVDTLVRKMNLEERVYRLRCVEAWSMAVPWTGFPMADLVKFARPLSGAKYVVMETFSDEDMAPGQKQYWYPWPYLDGLTIEEATNELALIGTGLYGKPMPKQNGAPLRLVVPWKYGFKSIKSIVRFSFTDTRPMNFWERVQPREYGFWANVNPKVPHPRWSQATEEVMGTGNRVKTLLFNGYGDYVADLYKNKKGEKLFM